MFIVGKFDYSLNVSCSAGESVENGVDISSLLHWDDAKLILLVNPDEESLLLVVENTSTVGPVTVQASDLKETISLPEKN